MKTRRFFHVIIVMMLAVACLFTSACDTDFGTLQGGKAVPLSAPTNVQVDGNTLKWNYVENAIGYVVKIVTGPNLDVNSAVGEEIPIDGMATTSYSLEALAPGDYTIGVKARGDSVAYSSSVFAGIQFKRVVDIGGEFGEGEIRRPFGDFDDINTKNSFLGYGLDIINASAISSKNILMTYPIFDMDLLQNEMLLYSNEHYNDFAAIEGETIEAFLQGMSNSTSISSGSKVSAKGKFKGVTASASVSMSGGLSTAFSKTSSSVQSQYFLEIISENQSYWLILQSSEDRYKEMLSEDFKKDLYGDMSPAELFEKYGTHLLTSVAMGGNIHMYYTLYSYDESQSVDVYAKISNEIKTNVKAAYGKQSVSAGTQQSFENTFTYTQTASQHGVYIDERIFCAGGGSYGINNSTTLFDNYYDWQNSLDLYPVVIGIKDSNSLYPIWDLIDMNVEGAEERYNELYNFFLEYGMDSLNELYETYAITPAVAPDGITNIKVNGDNYAVGSFAQTKAGDSVRISFDVTPDNANKYKKLYTVYSDMDTDTFKAATIDESGIMTVSPKVKSGTYITVMITAGPVTEHVTFYVINSFNVNFNTRVAGLEVAPIIGVLEGYSIEEPEVFREGWILEGWYKDSDMTQLFNFETDSIYGHTTLYAKWTAIKPTVTFDSLGGSSVNSETVAYKGSASVPKAPTKNGYTFGGWYIDEDCTVEFDFSTALVEDITVYAKWNRIEYTVTFETNGGTPVAPVTTSIENDYLIQEPVTEKALYIFKGWYADAALTTPFYFGSQITADTTIYADWEEKVFTVKYFVEGSKYLEEQSYHFGDTINYYSWPTSEGKQFSGWIWTGGSLPETMPAEDMILEGSFDRVLYTVKYFIDGVQVATESVYKGHSIPEYEYLKIKTGNTFHGWSMKTGDGFVDKPEVMPEKDIELHGSFEANYYTITFLNCDVAPITAQYGSPISKPADPTRTGYTFAGWDREIPETMPAENITITGGWSNNKHTVNYNLNGDGLKGTFSVNGVINQTTYDVTTVINTASPSYAKYYNFDGWYTSKTGGVKIANSNGQLLKNVAGYTDSDGKWVHDKAVTLYARWSQTYTGYTYIDTPSELQNIAEKGSYLLLRNLDMNGMQWTPIYSFAGVLNGDDHTISGISYTYLSDDNNHGESVSNYGFIRELKGTIQNITFDKLTIQVMKYRDGINDTNIGGVVGYLNGGTVNNVHVNNSYIWGDHYREVSASGSYVNTFIGGLVGRMVSGTVKDCSIAGITTVWGKAGKATSSADAQCFAGGMVGYLSGGVVSGCRRSDSVSVSSRSRVDGRNSASRSVSGGIVGLKDGGTVTSCTSTVINVSGEWDNAGKYSSDYSYKLSGAIIGRG